MPSLCVTAMTMLARDDMKEITIQYTYTIEEAVVASVELTKSVIRWSQALPWIGIILIVSSVMALFVFDKTFADLTPPIVFGVIFATMPFLTRWTVKRRARKNPSIGNVITWEITDSGLKNSTVGAESKFVWEKLLKVEEREKGFLLFSQPRIAHWLPKHGFTGEADIVLFREIAKSKKLQYKG